MKKIFYKRNNSGRVSKLDNLDKTSFGLIRSRLIRIDNERIVCTVYFKSF